MSTPVLLSVVLSLQTALQAISTASGYFNDLKASSVVLDATPLSAIPPTEVPFLVIGHLVAPVERDWHRSRSGALGAIQDRWKITLEAVIDAPGMGTARKLTALTNFEADVEKAVTVDLQRGGLALYTYVMQGTRYTGLANQNRCYIEIPIDVLLSRPYAQP